MFPKKKETEWKLSKTVEFKNGLLTRERAITSFMADGFTTACTQPSLYEADLPEGLDQSGRSWIQLIRDSAHSGKDLAHFFKTD